MEKLLSVIIPSYNEEAMIAKTTQVLANLLSNAGIHYELLFIDDGSSDQTWAKIQEASQTNKHVCGLHFSRNFGKEAAIMSGLTACQGDCAVVIDCDLQHPPQKILEMYQLWEEGYEVIEGQKSSRGNESFLHTFATRTFYRMISKATGFDMLNASDFKLLDRKAVNVIINMHEHNAFFRALSSWVGFKTTSIQFDVQEREAGESKWSTKSLIKYAISNITSFSTAPMQIVTALGIVMFLISIILSVISLVQKCMGIALGGFTTVILLQLFTGSITMISLGIIGYYIARIYEEIKGRPRYIVADTCGNVQKDA